MLDSSLGPDRQKKTHVCEVHSGNDSCQTPMDNNIQIIKLELCCLQQNEQGMDQLIELKISCWTMAGVVIMSH